MKKVFTKQNFRIAFIIFYIFIATASLSYAYLIYNFSQNTAADVKEYRIPYKALPDNCNLLIVVPDSSGFVMQLDFYNKQIECIPFNYADNDAVSVLGNEIDYRLIADYELISNIIDRVGGIEANLEDEELRYTGVQIKDIISINGNTEDIRYSVLIGILKKISENGFSKDDFSYIIEYGNTDLTVPVCYDWEKYIKQMCSSVNISG